MPWIEELVKKLNLEEWLEKVQRNYSETKNPANLFWNIMKTITQSRRGGGAYIIRKAGYDALYDEGGGVMHRSEPYQIVFVNPSFNVLEMVILKSTRNKINRLAHTLLTRMADRLFDAYKITSSRRYSRSLTANGTINGHNFKLNFEYYDSQKNTYENTPFKAAISFYGSETPYEFPKEIIEVPENEPFDLKDVDNLTNMFKTHLARVKYHDVNKYIVPFIKEINQLLGLTKEPKIGTEEATIQRHYHDGSFNFNLYFSKYSERYLINLTIQTKGDDAGKIYASIEIPELGEPKELLKELFDQVEQNIMTHYNPDEDKNTGDIYWKYKSVRIGQKLLKFLKKIKNKQGVDIRF
jgi:hypothetical protein